MPELPEFKDFPRTPKDTRFYVVLSGLIPLVEHARGLRAFMLDISQHAHLAGQWLVEQTVPRRLAVELKGVKAGGASLVNQNPGVPIVNLQGKPVPDGNQLGIWAQFDLPSPRKFHFLHACPFLFADSSAVLLNTPTVMTGTCVLEYELEESGFEGVRLEESPNKAWWLNESRRTEFDREGKIAVGSLHLVDGTVGTIGENHNNLEYQLNLNVFGASPISPRKNGDPLTNVLPEGLSAWETLPLAWRPASADALQDVLRTGSVQKPRTIEGGCQCCCAPAHARC